MKSNRKYLAVVESPANFVSSLELSLPEIMYPKKDDWEFIYSLYEFVSLDTILDMPLLSTLNFPASRDTKGLQAILIRIK